MTAAKKPPAIRAEKSSETGKIRNLTEELSREEYSLGMPLLDAAVAGVILGFKPSDREMRVQAQRCWEILKPQLNQHLLSEDETVLPWAEDAGGISPEVMDRIKKSHREMRSLIRKLVGVSFEEDPDKVVAVAGKALCVLAVKLDDLIDSEEMRLLPALRRMLFAQIRLAPRRRGLCRTRANPLRLPPPILQSPNRLERSDRSSEAWQSAAPA
ncbi:MAG: hemerythrin domain-containing protein [Candidatus Binatus sp.]